MAGAEAKTPVHGRVVRVAGALVHWLTESRRRCAWALVLSLVIATLALLYGKQIEVNTDLRALLPKTAPSVVALDELERRKGSAERFIVAIEAPTEADANAMAEGVAEEIRTWPEASELTVVRDYTPMRDHGLYFLDLEQLEDLRDELETERKKAVARAMGPGLAGGPVDVEAVSAGSDWDDMGGDELDWGPPGEGEGEGEGEGGDGTPGEGADGGEGAGEAPGADEAPGAGEADSDESFDLGSFLDEQRAAMAENSELDAREVALIFPDENEQGEVPWREAVGLPFSDESGTIRTVQASLTEPATDVEFAEDVVGRVERRAQELREAGLAVETRVEVVAAYDVTRDVDTILRDARRATWISAALVFAVLVLGFRNLRAIVLILAPMTVAMALTLAVAQFAFGQLNALTAFLFAVLFGMGVDFSVHLYALRERQGREANWGTIIQGHLRPLTATMVTTSGSLAILSMAEFKAFREFGIISAIGVAICLLTALILVPAIDTLFGPLRRESAPRVEADKPLAPRLATWFSRARWLLLAGVAVTAVIGAPQLEIEKDTREIKAQRPPGEEKIAYSSTNSRCSKSLALVAESPEDLDGAIDALLAERGQLLPGRIDTGHPRRPWVDKVYSLRTLMPTQQEEKAELIAEIGERANDFLAELPDLDEEAQRYRTHLETLERLAQADPLTRDELPSWALEPFREKDGRNDRIGHACLTIAGYHIDELVAVRHRLDELFGELEVHPADSRLVFADLMVLVERDARRLPAFALGAILLLIGLDLRRVGPTLACFSTLTLGLGLVLGLMGLWPLRLNFFNLVVMPAVVGLGIDASIHLWHARKRASLATTAKASLLAALTTVAGFSGLLAAEHSGLRSIGEVGVVAIIACVGVAFLALYPVRRRPVRRGRPQS